MEKLVYGPLELPSGKKIKFRAPMGTDRNNVMQMSQITVENALSDAMMVDEYLAAKCITEINDKVTDGDYKNLFNEWSNKDILFYKAVFDEMFGLNEESRTKAKQAAAFLLKG